MTPRDVMQSETATASFVQDLLVCPQHRTPLARAGDRLRCWQGHAFPIVGGIPVLLDDRRAPTHPGWWTDTSQLWAAARELDTLDPVRFVRENATVTCGNLYRELRGPFRYPLPELRMPRGDGALFLDVGGNWGRWSLSAARAGYRALCVDPSLAAASVGRRIAAELGLAVAYVVGDARCLPLRDSCVDVAFSYSVLQSLERTVVSEVLQELSRVVKPGGRVRVQMPNALGVRQLRNHARRALLELRARLRDGVAPERWMFYVRAWTLPALRRVFGEAIGPTQLSIDGFFSLNAQLSDLDLLSDSAALVVYASELLRVLGKRAPFLIWLADSVYVDAQNDK